MSNCYYKKAVERNFIEVANAIQKRQVLVAIDKYVETNGRIYFSGMSFFELASRALFNDIISHTIKVLDFDKESKTFWYILKNGQDQLKSLQSYSEDKVKSLIFLSKKLKHVRDKTHFHIDKQGVLDPKKIWHEAKISGKGLGKGLECLFDLLFELRNLIRKENMSKNQYSYSADDVIKLLDLAKDKGLISVQNNRNNQKRLS